MQSPPADGALTIQGNSPGTASTPAAILVWVLWLRVDSATPSLWADDRADSAAGAAAGAKADLGTHLNKMRRSVIWLLSSSLSKCAFRTGCSSKVPAVRIFKWSVAWLVFNNRIIYSGPIDLCTFLSNERRLGGISGVTALFWRFIDWGYQPPASSGSVPVHIWLKVFEIWDELPQETIHYKGGSNFEFQRGKMAMRVK